MRLFRVLPLVMLVVGCASSNDKGDDKKGPAKPDDNGPVDSTPTENVGGWEPTPEPVAPYEQPPADVPSIKVTVDGTDQVFENAKATQYLEPLYVHVVADKKGSTDLVQLNFPAKAGSYKCNDDVRLHYGNPDGTLYGAGKFPTTGAPIYAGSCSLDVQELGAVGGHVRGTFSAKMVRADDPTVALTIAGSFDAIRGEDAKE